MTPPLSIWPQAPPSSSQPLSHPTLLSHTKNKWVIGHKVSARFNPLLISLWGLRQGSGCSVELAADGRRAALTGRQRRPGGVYWDPSKENTITTHCHHCLPYTWAGFRFPQHSVTSMCVPPSTHTHTHSLLSCHQIVLWTYACSFSLCLSWGCTHSQTHTYMHILSMCWSTQAHPW